MQVRYQTALLPELFAFPLGVGGDSIRRDFEVVNTFFS